MIQTKSFLALGLIASVLTLPLLAQGGAAALYKTKCASCHGEDGQAATPMGKATKALPFKDPALLKAADARFLAATSDGKGKMPAYKGKLSDAEIKDLVAYIRLLQKK
jgi:mono/diheme cytochrome c family protein